jgi:ABC-type transporter Mla subunit MlaD
MEPVTKKAAQASRLVEQQTGSIARLRDSVTDAAQTAKRLNASRPDNDTAALILSLRIATSETDTLRGTNEDLRLAISGMEVVIAQAQDKISVEIAGAETWRRWAWRWWWAFAGTVAAIAALVYFRHSIPLLRFL